MEHIGATIISMNRDILHIPAELTGVTVKWKGEGTAADESEPTVAELKLDTERLTAYSIVSNELLDDEDYDLVGFLTRQFAEAIGQELDNQLFNGSTPFSGLLGASGAGYSVVMGSGSTSMSMVNWASVHKMKKNVSSRRRTGAKFYMHREAMYYCEALEDSQKRPLLLDSYRDGTIRILGYVAEEVEKCPAEAEVSSGSAFILFGNLKHAIIGRRKGDLTLAVDPYGKFLESQTRFKIDTRWALGKPYPAAVLNHFVKLVCA